jgi:hypothetical protein
MDKKPIENRVSKKSIPVAKNEDVEYSTELADQKDLEAAIRSEEADKRQH